MSSPHPVPEPPGLQSALAALRATAGCVPIPRVTRGPRLRLRIPGILIFVVFMVLLSVSSASSVNIDKRRLSKQSASQQEWDHTYQEMLCRPGTHLSENSCRPCTDKQDYTAYQNNLSSCLPCTVCTPDQTEVVPCTVTTNTVCECKPGTFREENSPEICQNCSRCSNGMVEDSPCTPKRDRKCISQQSGTRDSGVTPVPGELLTNSLPPSSSVYVLWKMAIIFMSLGFFTGVVICCWKCKHPGFTVDRKKLKRALDCFRPARTEPGTLDNVRNSCLSNTQSLSTEASEQEPESQQQEAELRGVTVQSPQEAEPLMAMPGNNGSQERKLLVPVNAKDATERKDCLLRTFDYFTRHVPFKSWNRFMRQVGLTNNEIQWARDKACDSEDALHQMLLEWHSKTGQGASVNTLLKALQKTGNIQAMEEIEEELVRSGVYAYEDGDSAV